MKRQITSLNVVRVLGIRTAVQSLRPQAVTRSIADGNDQRELPPLSTTRRTGA